MDIYLVCNKGNTSIFDKLIKIIKQHSTEHIPKHKEIDPEIEKKYTHVGLCQLNTIPTEGTITYYACREDAGVMEYTESVEDLDLYKINLNTVDWEVINNFYNNSWIREGSMITDMGYPLLAKPHTMGSVEWVAVALNLAFPKKYSITKLINFAQLEE